MTPDTTAELAAPPSPATPETRSTAGMTTKVVKGSMWTLVGQLLPMLVAFISTPFVIRFLGSEAYGVLLLVSLIPTYFNFADFGMGMASTKFAAEAYGEGDSDKERAVLWTAGAIAATSSLLVATPIFIFSTEIASALNVPENYMAEATFALRIGSGTFVLGVLANVLNSPMLARLRMDLNTLTVSVPKIFLSALTPFILYFGFGIVGAVSWGFLTAVIMLAAILFFGDRLLRGIYEPTFDQRLLKQLLTFGGAWFVAMIAAMLLVNFEKLVLTRFVSVRALAYYSVAFTFANIAGLFSQAMIQSLIPAFSQLTTPEKRPQLEDLFRRSIRLNLTVLLPAVLFLFIVARPFFGIWAGEEFARESSVPSYILLLGLIFNVLAFTPHSLIIASGRSDLFARLYWLELSLYVVLAVVLIANFGIIGAASAWASRVILDAVAQLWLAKRAAAVSLRFSGDVRNTLLSALVLVPVVLTAALGGSLIAVGAIAAVSLAAYALLIWKVSLSNEERAWAKRVILRVAPTG